MYRFLQRGSHLLGAILLGGLAACAQATPTQVSVQTPVEPTATLVALPSETPAADRIAAEIPVSRPQSLTVWNGLVWVVSSGSVLSIDPATAQVTGEPIQSGARLEDIVFSEDALWGCVVASGDLGAPSDTDAVLRIDPQSGETVATINVSRGPMSLAVTPEAIWVVNFGANGDSVVRIDPSTNQVQGEPIVTGRAPLSMAVGEGSVWVANHDAGSVTRIDPETGQVIADIPVPSEPHRVAYGEGMIWVANFHGDSVTRIDPESNEVIGEPIPIGPHPAGNLAIGHGSVWVTSDYRIDGEEQDKVLVRIDAQTGELLETISLGGHPIDVAVTEDAVWVSVQGPDRVVKIIP